MSMMARIELFDRARLRRAADGLMIAVAVSLPWSTSATGILLVIWLLAVLPTTTAGEFAARDIGRAWRPAGFAVSARRRRHGLGRRHVARALARAQFIFQASGNSYFTRAIPAIRPRALGRCRISCGFVRRIAGRDGHSHGDTVSIYADS